MSISMIALATCFSGAFPDGQFLDQHDLIWEMPPARWIEGIPLGNGHIGALVWGAGTESVPLRITLDRYDAWETRERVLGEGDVTYRELRRLVAEGKRKEAEDCLWHTLYPKGSPYPTRLPMPRFELTCSPPLAWDEGRLSLHKAAITLRAQSGGRSALLTVAVHAQRNVVVIRLTGGATQLTPHLRFDHLDEGARRLLEQWGYPAPATTESQDAGSLVLRAPNGYECAAAWERVRAANGDELVCLALLSNEDAAVPLDAARGLAREACKTEGDLATHEAWWADYWTKSFITIPDARLEALYYIEMYKLGSLARPGGYPITLQGLWTRDGAMPPWSGDYHLDMNVQQTYWPIYTANRLELGEPLYRTFSRCIPRWQAQCRQFFGFDGIWSGCAIGPRGERVFGYSAVELWPGNAAWLAHHYWLHFLYSQDEAFLRDQALPMIRLAFLTYANLLEPEEDGKLHVPLSNSPEWREGSFDAFCKDPTCDLALIRFLGSAILKANDVLGVEDGLTQRVREVLERLVEPQQTDHCLFISAGTPLTHSHRHHSHLMGIHPLGLLTVEGSETERVVIRSSLAQIRHLGTGQWTGWSFPWMALIASRAGYGNMAWQMLDIYANCFIKPNTFHVNGDPRNFGLTMFDYEPMTLEAGFGAAAAVMETLLQSHNGRIRLFPSMPDRWHDAYFTDLRAEGAFLVTAKRIGDAVPFVLVKSEAGRPCEIANPFTGEAELEPLDQESPVHVRLGGNILQFETAPNTRYLLYPAGRPPTQSDLQPLRFDRTDLDRNFYGLKRHPRF